MGYWSPSAAAALAAINADPDYGRLRTGTGQSLLLEFVSANPTGPLTLLHGRSAAFGDALGNLLDWTGWDVRREYYVNDAGGQAERLGRSVQAYYLQHHGQRVGIPEDGYHDDYIRDLARNVAATAGPQFLTLPEPERVAALSRLAGEQILREHQETLQSMGISFDRWYSEQELHASGSVSRVVDQLREQGHVYELDGALWLKASAFGDQKDRPLVRSNGLPTYIAADLAYHLDKFRRGFSRVVNIWGPDHEEYLTRTRAGIAALGIDPGRLEAVTIQPVTLKVDGMIAEGTTRRRLYDVLREVGPDTARFLYLTCEADQPMEFDFDLARQADWTNPHHLVQAVTKMATEAAGVNGGTAGESPSAARELPLSSAAAGALVAQLERFPAEVQQASQSLDPSQIARYSIDTSRMFLDIQEPAGDPIPSPEARAQLAGATRTVLENSLKILGVQVPGRR